MNYVYIGILLFIIGFIAIFAIKEFKKSKKLKNVDIGITSRTYIKKWLKESLGSNLMSMYCSSIVIIWAFIFLFINIFAFVYLVFQPEFINNLIYKIFPTDFSFENYLAFYLNGSFDNLILIIRIILIILYSSLIFGLILHFAFAAWLERKEIDYTVPLHNEYSDEEDNIYLSTSVLINEKPGMTVLLAFRMLFTILSFITLFILLPKLFAHIYFTLGTSLGNTNVLDIFKQIFVNEIFFYFVTLSIGYKIVCSILDSVSDKMSKKFLSIIKKTSLVQPVLDNGHVDNLNETNIDNDEEKENVD